jgi:hypothetical protein
MTSDPKALADAIDPRLAVSPEFAAAYPEQVKEGRWCNGGAVLMAAADYIRAQASPPAASPHPARRDRAMTEQLKPCPFCGDPAEFRGWDGVKKTAPEVWVACSRCAASSDTRTGPLDAARVWNTRRAAEPPADVMEVVKNLHDVARYLRADSLAVSATVVDQAADILSRLSLSTQEAQDRAYESAAADCDRFAEKANRKANACNDVTASMLHMARQEMAKGIAAHLRAKKGTPA